MVVFLFVSSAFIFSLFSEVPKLVFDNIPIIFGSVWNWRRRWPRRTGGATAVITIAAGHGRQKRHHRTTAPLHRRASCTVAGTAVWLRQWMWMWLGILILAFRVPAQETIICCQRRMRSFLGCCISFYVFI